MSTLEGRTALVTGASRGIGRAIAERLAADGALTAVHYNSSPEAATDVVRSITAAGGRAFALHADLGVDGGAEQLWSKFDAGKSEFGDTTTTGLDVLVNNAGIAIGDYFDAASAIDLDRMYAVNVRAPFVLTQFALKRLRDGGRIVNISSAITRLALPEVIGYGLTKAALDTFSLILAKELGARGITVNSVAPGFVDTDANADWLLAQSEVRAAVAGQSVFGRVGAPEDIADVVAFLASDAGRWITGQVIDATGGTRL